jgi:hypothetical protein
MRTLLGFVACAQGNQSGLKPAEEVPYRGLRKRRRRQRGQPEQLVAHPRPGLRVLALWAAGALTIGNLIFRFATPEPLLPFCPLVIAGPWYLHAILDDYAGRYTIYVRRRRGSDILGSPYPAMAS